MRKVICSTLVLSCLVFFLTIFSDPIYSQIPSSEELQQMNWDEENTDELSEEKLSEINWDAEDSSEITPEEKLSDVNWDDEDTLDQQEEESEGASQSAIKAFDATVVNKRDTIQVPVNNQTPFQVHMFGSLAFFLYLAGGLITAYGTRNSHLVKKIQPEWIVILHSLWPLEWVLWAIIDMKKKA